MTKRKPRPPKTCQDCRQAVKPGESLVMNLPDDGSCIWQCGECYKTYLKSLE